EAADGKVHTGQVTVDAASGHATDNAAAELAAFGFEFFGYLHPRAASLLRPNEKTPTCPHGSGPCVLTHDSGAVTPKPLRLAVSYPPPLVLSSQKATTPG
ncbi:unnamed protein product, partial [marine sediment metagenome]